MILIFHLSKYFLKISKLFLRSTTQNDLLVSRPASQTTQTTNCGYIRKNGLFVFVWSQGASCNFTRLLG